MEEDATCQFKQIGSRRGGVVYCQGHSSPRTIEFSTTFKVESVLVIAGYIHTHKRISYPQRPQRNWSSKCEQCSLTVVVLFIIKYLKFTIPDNHRTSYLVISETLPYPFECIYYSWCIAMKINTIKVGEEYGFIDVCPY